MSQASETVQLPLYGKIAAGTPIEALRDQSRTLDLPASLLGRGEHFALEVEGDSMIEAGIYDGDTVVVERADTAENGAIVVALIDDNEATLKRLRRKGASIALEPANPNYETRIFGPDRVKVQGRLVGLFRRYRSRHLIVPPSKPGRSSALGHPGSLATIAAHGLDLHASSRNPERMRTRAPECSAIDYDAARVMSARQKTSGY